MYIYQRLQIKLEITRQKYPMFTLQPKLHSNVRNFSAFGFKILQFRLQVDSAKNMYIFWLKNNKL